MLVQVNCHWPCGRVQQLELDHWPTREELPADAVRFDIAWPDPGFVTLPSGSVYCLDAKWAKALGGRPTTAAELRQAAAHDTSCVGAFARARP